MFSSSTNQQIGSPAWLSQQSAEGQLATRASTSGKSHGDDATYTAIVAMAIARTKLAIRVKSAKLNSAEKDRSVKRGASEKATILQNLVIPSVSAIIAAAKTEHCSSGLMVMLEDLEKVACERYVRKWCERYYDHISERQVQEITDGYNSTVTYETAPTVGLLFRHDSRSDKLSTAKELITRVGAAEKIAERATKEDGGSGAPKLIIPRDNGLWIPEALHDSLQTCLNFFADKPTAAGYDIVTSAVAIVEAATESPYFEGETKELFAHCFKAVSVHQGQSPSFLVIHFKTVTIRPSRLGGQVISDAKTLLEVFSAGKIPSTTFEAVTLILEAQTGEPAPYRVNGRIPNAEAVSKFLQASPAGSSSQSTAAAAPKVEIRDAVVEGEESHEISSDSPFGGDDVTEARERRVDATKAALSRLDRAVIQVVAAKHSGAKVAPRLVAEVIEAGLVITDKCGVANKKGALQTILSGGVVDLALPAEDCVDKVKELIGKKPATDAEKAASALAGLIAGNEAKATQDFLTKVREAMASGSAVERGLVAGASLADGFFSAANQKADLLIDEKDNDMRSTAAFSAVRRYLLLDEEKEGQDPNEAEKAKGKADDVGKKAGVKSRGAHLIASLAKTREADESVKDRASTVSISRLGDDGLPRRQTLSELMALEKEKHGDGKGQERTEKQEVMTRQDRLAMAGLQAAVSATNTVAVLRAMASLEEVAAEAEGAATAAGGDEAKAADDAVKQPAEAVPAPDTTARPENETPQQPVQDKKGFAGEVVVAADPEAERAAVADLEEGRTGSDDENDLLAVTAYEKSLLPVLGLDELKKAMAEKDAEGFMMVYQEAIGRKFFALDQKEKAKIVIGSGNHTFNSPLTGLQVKTKGYLVAVDHNGKISSSIPLISSEEANNSSVGSVVSGFGLVAVPLTCRTGRYVALRFADDKIEGVYAKRFKDLSAAPALREIPAQKTGSLSDPMKAVAKPPIAVPSRHSTAKPPFGATRTAPARGQTLPSGSGSQTLGAPRSMSSNRAVVRAALQSQPSNATRAPSMFTSVRNLFPGSRGS